MVVESPLEQPGTGGELAEALLLDREQVERLVGLAFNRFGIRRQDAEELLAETYLELSGCDAVVRSPKGFAFHIFYTRCCRWLDRDEHRMWQTVGLDPAADQRNRNVENDLDWTLALRQAFAHLSAVCRRLLVGYYVEGLSLKETAETTGHSPKQVWKRLDACLRRLKRCLEA
jgi:RNA polymerase sigma factor (sigma-70 family)